MIRALVFEDEPSSQEIARRALRRIGITDVAFATDGATGLKTYDLMKPLPELILCDIFMPEKDGIEIVEALVDRNFKGGLILVTGADARFQLVAQTIAIHRNLHFLGSLHKPLDDVELAKTLAPLIKA